MVSSPPQIKPCQLDSKVQSLLELICDLKAMEECVLEMKFDIKKAPLGECVCICVPNDSVDWTVSALMNMLVC